MKLSGGSSMAAYRQPAKASLAATGVSGGSAVAQLWQLSAAQSSGGGVSKWRRWRTAEISLA